LACRSCWNRLPQLPVITQAKRLQCTSRYFDGGCGTPTIFGDYITWRAVTFDGLLQGCWGRWGLPGWLWLMDGIGR
jgi:hypothetical protein